MHQSEYSDHSSIGSLLVYWFRCNAAAGSTGQPRTHEVGYVHEAVSRRHKPCACSGRDIRLYEKVTKSKNRFVSPGQSKRRLVPGACTHAHIGSCPFCLCATRTLLPIFNDFKLHSELVCTLLHGHKTRDVPFVHRSRAVKMRQEKRSPPHKASVSSPPYFSHTRRKILHRCEGEVAWGLYPAPAEWYEVPRSRAQAEGQTECNEEFLVKNPYFFYYFSL